MSLGRQCPAIEVIALQLGIAEGDDLGEKRVGADELVQGVLEAQPTLLGESFESLGTVEVAIRRGDRRSSASAMVIRTATVASISSHAEHVVMVELAAGVAQQVRIGRWGYGAP